MTHEAFPFDKMIPGMLDPGMIEDTAKIVNEALNGGYRVNLMNNLLFFPSGHEVGLFLAAENPGQRGRCRPSYPQDQKRGAPDLYLGGSYRPVVVLQNLRRGEYWDLLETKGEIEP